jgi:hypothetical protein
MYFKIKSFIQRDGLPIFNTISIAAEVVNKLVTDYTIPFVADSSIFISN